jgi:uncharacterized protein DUF1524
MPRRWVPWAVAAFVVVLALGWRGSLGPAPAVSTSASPVESISALATRPSPSPAVAPGPSVSQAESTPAVGEVLSLTALLERLPITAESRTGYERDLFPTWLDADGDGCNTREEVLIAEAVVAPTVGAGCHLAGGRWTSAYDNRTLTDPAQIQIDHVVALAEAWDSGASAWTTQRRAAFANDLGEPWELIGVSGESNQAKSDNDPADWLPPLASAECPFLADYLATKVRWNLAVDPRERDALAGEIADCPGTERPFEPAPAGSNDDGSGGSTPGPSSGGTDAGCDPAYPTVCIAPPPPDLDCADIPYRRFTVLAPDPHRFDGDHDGIGCET